MLQVYRELLQCGAWASDAVNNAGWSDQAGFTECGYSPHELIHSSHAGQKERYIKKLHVFL